MDLKEFISETISAIADATTELQIRYEPEGIIVNPPSAQSGADVFQEGSRNYTMRRVQNIEFDVAVTASSETQGGGKAGIRVMSLEVGAEAGKSVGTEQVSRVRFALPVTLRPSQQEAENTQKAKAHAEASREKSKKQREKSKNWSAF